MQMLKNHKTKIRKILRQSHPPNCNPEENMFFLLPSLIPSRSIGSCSTRREGGDIFRKKSDFVCLIAPQLFTQRSSRGHQRKLPGGAYILYHLFV